MAEIVSVGPEDLDALTVGVSLLGSGGGGTPLVFSQLLKRRLSAGRIELADAETLADRLVVPVGAIGASSALLEKLPGGTEWVDAVEAISRWSGHTPQAVMNTEAGGLNGLVGMIAAVDLGLPFLDADLMGRAFPRIDQFSWAVQGLPLTPCALVAPGGQLIVVDRASPARLERAARGFLSQSSGWAAIALPVVSMQVVLDNSLLGSVARALALGRAHAALPGHPDPELVAAALGARLHAVGRVVGVTRDGQPGEFLRCSITVLDRQEGTVMRVEGENEYLLGLADGVPVVATPDVICLLERRHARPIMVDEVRVGDEVLALSLPAPTWWTEHCYRYAAAGPDAFGLNCRFPLDAEQVPQVHPADCELDTAGPASPAGEQR